MKRTIFLFILSLFLFSHVFCQDAYIDYLEGEVYIRDDVGYLQEAFADDELEIGNTIISGPDGLAEIYFGNSLIRMDENTVFQLLDNQEGGKKENIFSCVVGSVFLKIETLTEDELELQINTASANCGVRGTEFWVFSGMDGSSLIAVERLQ